MDAKFAKDHLMIGPQYGKKIIIFIALTIVKLFIKNIFARALVRSDAKFGLTILKFFFALMNVKNFFSFQVEHQKITKNVQNAIKL